MNDNSRHWLYRKNTRSKLWLGGIVILCLTVIAELFIKLHPHFVVASYFAFHAVFGFFSCVVMVLFAKILGILIKRRDNYYDR